MEFTYFIGTDISKRKLDIAVYKMKELLFHKQIANEQEAIKQFLKELKRFEGFTLSQTVFCMEFTGIYNNHFVYHLIKKGANVWLEPGSKIKNSLGLLRGKNDKLDALRIGKFAYKNSDEVKLWKPRRKIVNRIHHLITLRRRLITVKNMLKTPLKEMDLFVEQSIQSLCVKLDHRTLKSIESDILKIDKLINKIIHSDKELTRLTRIITSVQGVGIQTAASMIVTTNEFQDITDPKKYACYCGVAPFPKESGNFKAPARVSHLANKKIKKLLHLSAMSAINYNLDMKQYYDRKVAEGKNKLAVINAVRNKLIHRIFACVHQNREYEKNYTTTLA